MTKLLDDIPNFLHEFRKWYENRNIRQEDIAEQLGVTRWHLSKVLYFFFMPSIKLLGAMEKLMEE